MDHKIYAIMVYIFASGFFKNAVGDKDTIDIVDMTNPTDWNDMSDYYNAVRKQWKICMNCGSPGLGTAMHLGHSYTEGSRFPSTIPSEYLLTRLSIIDVSSHMAYREDFVLTLEEALQWLMMKHDPREPTLLLFKFGWNDKKDTHRIKSCICKIPGISYELAEWISKNMTHVVGVATDAPTLESEQTREFTYRTVANMLGRNGVYIIENVLIMKKIPEHGCMAMAMPLKLTDTNYVPTRLTAFCPTTNNAMNVVVALRKLRPKPTDSRIYDVNIDDLLTL